MPGVSAVTAVPAYAGIPLTSAKAREVRVVNAAEGTVDWASLAAGTRRCVLLSATKGIGDVAKALVAAGRDARDAGRDDPARHDHRAAHRRVDARARSRPT